MYSVLLWLLLLSSQIITHYNEQLKHIFRNRDGESKCDKCGMECCSAAHLNLLHNRRPADAFVGGKKALEMLRLVLPIAFLILIV